MFLPDDIVIERGFDLSRFGKNQRQRRRWLFLPHSASPETGKQR